MPNDNMIEREYPTPLGEEYAVKFARLPDSMVHAVRLAHAHGRLVVLSYDDEIAGVRLYTHTEAYIFDE